MIKKNKTMRLDKYLGNLGYGSRKELKEIVGNGLVKVDGEVVFFSDIKISPLSSRVELDGELIEYKENVYLIMNKPAGVISATSDSKGETPVTELLSDEFFFLGLSPVGRLDKDTVGLLMLTNDGKYNHQMTSPKKGIIKTYYAVVTGSYDKSHREIIKQGIIIEDGYKCKPAELFTLEGYVKYTGKTYLTEQCREFLPENKLSEDTYEAVISISEGKFHQVKRMFAALGQDVEYLKRIGFGDFDLPIGLKEGEYTEVYPMNI